jgi:tetratricopeptide (TPR) repeat protein
VTNPPFDEKGGPFSLSADEALGEAGRKRAAAHAAYATGRHHELREEWGAAAEAYGRALELDPGNGDAALRKACALAEGGDLRAALEWGEAWLAKAGDAPDMACWLAEAYADAGEWERAETLAAATTAKHRVNEKAWMILARARVQDDDNRVDEAVSVLEEGMEWLPGNCDLRKAAIRLLMADLDAHPEGKTSERRERAIGHLRLYDEAEPGDLETLDRLGALLLAEGRVDEALEVYAKVDRLLPEGRSVGEAGPLARALRRLGDEELAAEVMERLRQRGEATKEQLQYLAALRVESGDFAGAAEVYGELTAADPGDTALWLVRAATLEKADPAKAYEALEEGLEANPGAPDLLLAMGAVRLAMHRYAEADELLEKALAAYGAEGEGARVPPEGLYTDRVLSAVQRRRTGKAADRLAEGMKAYPGCVEEITTYGLCGTPGVKTNLIRTYQSFLSQAGKDAGTAERTAVWYAMARLQGALDQYDAAVASFEAGEAESGAPMPAGERWIYAVLLDQAGRRTDCIRELETVVREVPNLHMALNYLAYSMALEGIRLEEADRLVRRALALDPGNPAYRDTLAWIYHLRGQDEDAWAIIQTVMEMYGDESEEVREHYEAIREAVGAGNGE